jgi:outer membrane protein
MTAGILAGVLTLAEALAAARAHQPQLVEAGAATQAAQARADESLAGVLPQVSANANYQRSTANFTSRPGSLPSQISGSGGGESWDTFDYYNLGVAASVPVYDFGQARHRWRASQASAASQQESERATLQQVLFSVRSAFVQAQGAKGLVAVAHDTLANQQKHLEQTQGFVEVGTQAPIALAQAKTSVANAQVQVITAENGYETAKAQLHLAMGLEGSLEFDVADEPEAAVEGEDGTTDALLAEAVAARPEMTALARQVRAEELTVSAFKGAYGPSLDFDTGFTDAGARTNDLTWNWSAALLLSVPIYSGGERKAQVHESEANLVAARAQLDLERQQIRLDVEQARLAVRAARAALVASAEARDNAHEQLRLAEGRYATGSGSIIELGDAQVAYTAAAQQDVVASAALAQARALLLKALGRE